MKGWPEGHSKTGGRSSRDAVDRAGILQEAVPMSPNLLFFQIHLSGNWG